MTQLEKAMATLESLALMVFPYGKGYLQTSGELEGNDLTINCVYSGAREPYAVGIRRNESLANYSPVLILYGATPKDVCCTWDHATGLRFHVRDEFTKLSEDMGLW